MQQGGDYGAAQFYPHQYSHPSPNPGPNPSEFPPPNPIPRSYASAPPYSSYSAVEFPAYSSSYPPSYPQNPGPSPSLPPSAPSYSQPQPQSQPQPAQFAALGPYNPPPYPAEQPPAAAPYAHPQQPPSSAPAYYPYDAHQPAAAAANYGAPVNADSSANPNPGFSSPYGSYESAYESSAASFDHGGGGYYGENSGGYGLGTAGEYGRSRSGYEQDLYGKKPDDGLGEGVYAYDGGRLEPYGARGTAPSRSLSTPSGSSSMLFDDYGRSISIPSPGKKEVGSQPKIVRAVPKADAQPDVKSGVQKYRVKLLPEGAGATMDVLCQIGLDGIRMLDPSTSRTLRIYPLETLTRWEVIDASIFAFWSKSSVDIEPRRIRLQSNSYTTSTILDTVTAATVQFKEMGGRENLSTGKGTDSGKPSEKKKGFVDWMNFIKPANVEKDHWMPDEAVTKCTSCGGDFNAFNRRHHCRNCGDIFCDKCTQGRIALTADENAQPVRVCDRCMAEVSQRLTNAKESASRPAELHSHEDLARKLQEEMDKNRKSSSGSKSPDGSGRRMREVVCPTCTVHLQVQVPASGSETIECGVCQHPFLVSAH